MQINEHHWTNGIFFAREVDGAVRIRVQKGETSEVFATIPPHQWESIVAFVSPDGETSRSLEAATALHEGMLLIQEPK